MTFTKQVYGVTDVAQLLQMVESKVRKLAADGILPKHIVNTNTWVFLARDVESYVEIFVEPQSTQPTQALVPVKTLTANRPKQKVWKLGLYGDEVAVDDVIRLEEKEPTEAHQWPYEGKWFEFIVHVPIGHKYRTKSGKIWLPRAEVPQDFINALPPSKVKWLGKQLRLKAGK